MGALNETMAITFKSKLKLPCNRVKQWHNNALTVSKGSCANPYVTLTSKWIKKSLSQFNNCNRRLIVILEQ